MGVEGWTGLKNGGSPPHRRCHLAQSTFSLRCPICKMGAIIPPLLNHMPEICLCQPARYNLVSSTAFAQRLKWCPAQSRDPTRERGARHPGRSNQGAAGQEALALWSLRAKGAIGLPRAGPARKPEGPRGRPPAQQRWARPPYVTSGTGRRALLLAVVLDVTRERRLCRRIIREAAERAAAVVLRAGGHQSAS